MKTKEQQNLENRLLDAYHGDCKDEFIGAATAYVLNKHVITPEPVDYLCSLVQAYDKGSYKKMINETVIVDIDDVNKNLYKGCKNILINKPWNAEDMHYARADTLVDAVKYILGERK